MHAPETFVHHLRYSWMIAFIMSVIACLVTASMQLASIARVINNAILFSDLALNRAKREARKEEDLLTTEDRREI